MLNDSSTFYSTGSLGHNPCGHIIPVIYTTVKTGEGKERSVSYSHYLNIARITHYPLSVAKRRSAGAGF